MGLNLPGDTVKSAKSRAEKAEIRRKLRSGELQLYELLEDIPPCVRNTPTLYVLDMAPYVGDVTLAAINYEAIRRGINLALPLGALTDRAKTFLAEWDRNRQKRRGRRNDVGKSS